MRRPWRGATLEVTIERDAARAAGEVAVEVDGRPVAGNLLPPLSGGGEVRVLVRCGL
jgi:hypothetical protein